MDYSCESFTSFCDRMMVYPANEGLKEGFHNMKNWIVKKIAQILDWVESKLVKINAPRIRNGLIDIIRNLKGLLAKTKALNEVNPDLANKFSREAETLKEKAEKLVGSDKNGSNVYVLGRNKNGDLSMVYSKDGKNQGLDIERSKDYDVTSKGRLVKVGDKKKALSYRDDGNRRLQAGYTTSKGKRYGAYIKERNL